MKKKIDTTIAGVGLCLLVLIDLIPVDRRYLNNSSFKLKKNWEKKVFAPSAADEVILSDPDPYYRVFNLTSGNPFSDASTSYLHKSIGGYSAIKMARYQDIIDSFLYKQDMNIVNMLNTKYFIYPDKDKNPVAQRNPGALGNAWFIDSVRYVPNADAEITAMKNFNARTMAIVDDDFKPQLEGFKFIKDSSASIKLESYHPNRLQYKSVANTEQIIVFSEIYYQPGWKAYVDGKPVQHFRANYILRAMRLPAGTHTIDFKFEPEHYYTGEKISKVGSIVLALFIIAMLVWEIRNKKKSNLKKSRSLILLKSTVFHSIIYAFTLIQPKQP
jgi:hypothetical protein